MQNKKLLAGLVLVIAVAVVLTAGFALVILNPSGDGKNVRLVDFPEGRSLRSFAAELERGGLIANARIFVLYARLRQDDARIKAGAYQFNDGLSPAEMLRQMVAGEVFAYRFAVPEGYSIYQVAELLEGKGLFSKETFLKRCCDPALLRELGIGGKSVEGYLYPSTYTIPPTMDETGLIRMMVGQFDKVYAANFSARVPRGLSPRTIVTLASMIEKEAVVPAERPLIASVFRNRLKTGMPLQSDPTAVYGVRAFAGKVSKQDIMRNSPYNTYMIKGLPPGPIGSPGSEAIEAAIAPADTRYLYFVAKKDGTHYFSTTLDEHNNAVRRFLK